MLLQAVLLPEVKVSVQFRVTSRVPVIISFASQGKYGLATLKTPSSPSRTERIMTTALSATLPIRRDT
jgi:hypothetical protein